MNQYVVGYMFDDGMQRVGLIHKNRPAWQKGLFNGIGGKIDTGETPLEAMVREFKEETGVLTIAGDWSHVCTLRFPYAEIECFASKSTAHIDAMHTNTDEEVLNASLSEILFSGRPYPAVENVPLLIQLSRQRLTDREGVAPDSTVQPVVCYHKFHRSGICTKCDKHWITLVEDGDNPFSHCDKEIEM